MSMKRRFLRHYVTESGVIGKHAPQLQPVEVKCTMPRQKRQKKACKENGKKGGEAKAAQGK